MIPNRLGPYEVVRELGGGGAGRVYLVTTPRGPAALKLLLPGWDLPEARRRFRMEAEALRRLDHPGFVRYLDHGDELQTPHGVRPFLLMEYVEGSSLRSWIRPGGRPVDEVLPILEGLASALDYAHERGVVHRDLKPENVLLESGTGRPRILDLGIARLPENWRETLDVATHTGELLGTVRYMSPEQVRGQVAECGPASDVYSLAVVLYELLTGRLPYAVEHETLHELLAAILTARPESLRRSGMSLPAALDRTIRLSLAKEPRARPQSAGGFAREVRAVASGDRRQQLRAVWRELRHTGAFPVRRVVLGIVLLASAAWIMHGRLAPSRPDFPSVYRQLQTAVELVHFGERSPDRLRAAIDALSSAREGVWSHEFSWRGPLERYIVLRLAEAGYLLGDMEEDPERLRWSEARYREALGLSCTRAERAQIPKRCPIRDEILSMAGHMPYSGQAMALEALAQFDLPRRNLGLAEEAAERGAMFAMGTWTPPAWDGPPFDRTVSARRQEIARAKALNDFAGVLSELGAVTDSLGTLDAALATFAAVDTFEALRGDRPAYASFQHQYGVALRRHGEWIGSTDELDMAERHLREALQARKPGTEVAAITRIELARVGLARAEVAGGDAATQLHEALREIESVGTRAGGSDLLRARVGVEAARVAAALASATGDSKPAAQADSLAAELLADLDPDRFSRVRAELFVGRARLRIRTGLDLAPGPSAMACLDSAEAALPPDQAPALAAESAGFRARLNSAQRGSVARTPVPSRGAPVPHGR